MPDPLPGSAGEHAMQREHGTADRAVAFYANQMLDHLNARMLAFLAEREMMFVSTADAHGHCDCTVRCGPAGFVIALDDKTVAWPEYRGNGVMASLGNVTENPHAGLLLIDFARDCVGLHVNGTATVVENDALLRRPGLPDAVHDACAVRGGRRPERWVVVRVDETYVHCAKHLPMLAKVPKHIHWGTDDPARKGGDYFAVAADRSADTAVDASVEHRTA